VHDSVVSLSAEALTCLVNGNARSYRIVTQYSELVVHAIAFFACVCSGYAVFIVTQASVRLRMKRAVWHCIYANVEPASITHTEYIYKFSFVASCVQ
jgi:hypothetical protein